MEFLEWNDRLASHFFNEEMDGREVLLNVNKRIIEEEIGQNAFGLDSFIECVKKGPPWVTRTGLCMKAYQAFDAWRSRNLEFPPYVAFLSLFVLANDTEGDFDPKAYYPRLHKLIGEDYEYGTLPSFHKMIDLWDDLEKWSKEDKKEELGSFTARIRGKHIHVGLPLSQTLLTSEERSSLPLLFDEANLEPGTSATYELLVNTLRHYGSKYFSARTTKLLSKSDTEFVELRKALVQLVQEELLIWDGTLPVSGEESDFTAKMRTGLRLCFEIEKLSGIVKSYMRLKFNRVIPEVGFYLTPVRDTQTLLRCLESTQRWSTPISDVDSGEPVNAFHLNWRDDFEIIDNEREWKAKLIGAEIRLFTKGKNEGLPGNHWIETTQVIQHNCEFLVACSTEFKELINDWIRKECELVNNAACKVLPNGWYLFHAKNARHSCDGVDILTFSPDLNLRFRGGFKLGRGNRYFNFGLPEIILENSRDENIRLIGEGYQGELTRLSDSKNIWAMPKDILPGRTYKFEVLKDGNPTQLRRNYAITIASDSELLTSNKIEPVKRASGGEFAADFSLHNFISGAKVVSDEKNDTREYNFLPLHLASKIILIGQRLDEICEFPDEPLPKEWNPVWLLAKKHRDVLLLCFCGDSLNLLPIATEKTASLGLKKRWKEVVWTERKHHDLDLLRLEPLRKLWRSYQGVAKNI